MQKQDITRKDEENKEEKGEGEEELKVCGETVHVYGKTENVNVLEGFW